MLRLDKIITLFFKGLQLVSVNTENLLDIERITCLVSTSGHFILIASID